MIRGKLKMMRTRKSVFMKGEEAETLTLLVCGCDDYFCTGFVLLGFVLGTISMRDNYINIIFVLGQGGSSNS